jgi:L-aminopeptidase/D-esterase-like protein
VRGYPTQDGASAADLTLNRANAIELMAPGEAFAALERAIDVGIAALCAEAVGAMDKLVAITVEYMNTRKQFGVPIATFQALRHRMADVKMQLELARSMSFFATLKLDEPAPARRRAIAQAKLQLGQSMRYVGQQCIQLHGGIGVSRRVLGRPLLQAPHGHGDDLRRLDAPARRGRLAHAGHGRRLRLSPPAPHPVSLEPTTRGLTAVEGLRVGHFTETRRPTGCTVILAPAGAVAGVDVRGASPGTRETELLSPLNAVEKVHAILLAGGSAFGLDAAGGVMRWLDERGIGVQLPRVAAAGPQARQPIRVPIVPSAILFDLWLGDPTIRPDAAAGYAACEAATNEPPEQGNVGAGAGASVGKLFGIERAMKGGLGSAAVTVGGVTVGALAAVNALGDIVDPATGAVVAGARTTAGDALLGSMRAILAGELPGPMPVGSATTLGVVATDARLTKAEANKVAQMAQDGLARSINPAHTMTDGDVVFALATGSRPGPANVTLIGALAAEMLAEAVLRGVLAARGIGGDGLPNLPAVCDL